MTDAHTDLSIVPVAVAPSPTTSGTTVKVTLANAAKLPSVYPWWGEFKPANLFPTRLNAEIVKVTAGSDDATHRQYTIIRAQGIPVTTARDVQVGDDFFEVMTAEEESIKTNPLTLAPAATTDTPLLIKRNASGTATQLKVTANDGTTVQASIDYKGAGTFNANNESTTGITVKGASSFDTGAAGQIGIKVKRRASQSVDMQEWLDENNNVLAKVDKDGNITAPNFPAATSLVSGEVPSGTVNGSNAVFTLAATPTTGTVRLFQNGVRLKITEDYTISGATITFNTAPATGDLILADYMVGAGVYMTGSTSFIDNETPSGTVNGSNTAFTLAFTPVTGTVRLYRDGQLLTGGAGNDYTISGASITMTTAPVTGSVLLAFYQKSVSVAGNADTTDGFHASDYSETDGQLVTNYGGWIKINAALTYSSADAPTYVVSTSKDLTGVIGVGMRIKFTNNSVTFYGIVTAITASTITLYGGTDYSVANSAITNPFFSYQKAPLGFPLNPVKWTVEVTDTSDREQATPTNGTWYNLGGLTISIPIGIWLTSFSVNPWVTGTSKTQFDAWVALSTANNSASDADLVGFFDLVTPSGNYGFMKTIFKNKYLVIASKTSYYLNAQSDQSPSTIGFRGDVQKTIIRAVCAYL